MSDGGAGVIVKVGAQGVKGAMHLAKFKVGRVVLWAIAVWLTLSGITNWSNRVAPWYFFIAIAVALIALVGGLLVERAKRAERANLRSALLLIGFTLVSIFGAMWLVFRKKKAAEVAAPTEEEVERLVAQ